MSIESERTKRIRKRWDDERKISGGDVTWLLEQADTAETMRAAGSLRNASMSRTDKLMDDILGFKL